MSNTQETKKLSVVAVIFNILGILMLKRHPYDRTLPDKLCLPGGKKNPGEKSFDALEREVKEETGLTVQSARKVAIDENDKFVITFYHAWVKEIPTEISVVLSDEHAAYEFIPYDEIESRKDEIGEVTYRVLMRHWVEPMKSILTTRPDFPLIPETASIHPIVLLSERERMDERERHLKSYLAASSVGKFELTHPGRMQSDLPASMDTSRIQSSKPNKSNIPKMSDCSRCGLPLGPGRVCSLCNF